MWIMHSILYHSFQNEENWDCIQALLSPSLLVHIAVRFLIIYYADDYKFCSRENFQC